MPLGDLCKDQEVDQWFEIQHNGEAAGMVHLKGSYKPKTATATMEAGKTIIKTPKTTHNKPSTTMAGTPATPFKQMPAHTIVVQPQPAIVVQPVMVAQPVMMAQPMPMWRQPVMPIAQVSRPMVVQQRMQPMQPGFYRPM